MIGGGELERRFRYSSPRGPGDVALHQEVTELTLELAKKLDCLLPDGRGKSLSLTRLEECRMWANASLAHARAEV